MILTGNREEEILTRAKNRTVTAIVSLSAPGVEKETLHGLFGMIVEKGRPSHALRSDAVYAQSAHMWQMDDSCVTLAEKDPQVLAEILETLAQRMKDLNTPKFSGLDFETRKIVFNSEDLVEKANGISARLTYSFHMAGGSVAQGIMSLPFPKLQSYLFHLCDKVDRIGGMVHSVDVAHGPSISSFEYYEMATKDYVPGKRFSYGYIMLARGERLLQEVGIPKIVPPTPSSKPH